MRSFGSRFEGGPDGGEQTMRVAQAHDYEVALFHYRRKVGNGSITCQTLKATEGPARRIVQLVAEYEEGGVMTTHVVGCHSIEEELAELERLEGVILRAERRPTSTPPAWRRQARGRAGAGSL